MKIGLVKGKIFLSLLAFMVGAALGEIIGGVVLSIGPKLLTTAFIWVLVFPVWYPSRILFRLVAAIVGPIVMLLFWSISLLIPDESVFMVAGVRMGAWGIAMLVQFFIMRQARVSPVAGTIYSDEKEGLEPEWVNSRDDLEPEFENNEETQRIDVEPIKTAHPWHKKLWIGWGVTSALWVLVVLLIGWNYDGHLLTDDIESVRLDVEKMVPRILTNNSNFDSNSNTREDSSISRLTFEDVERTLARMTEEEEAKREGKTLTREWFSATKLNPNSSELTQARKNFPSMNDMVDGEFSDHLWNLVQKEIQKERDYRSERFKERMLNGVVPALLFPPIIVLIVWFLISSGLNKFPPSELTPYAKKIIVASAVWVMGTISWFKIEEGLDDGEYVLVYILPPLVLFVASILWKWANKSPVDVSPQPDVDRAG